MKYLLDTNICIALIKAEEKVLVEKIESLQVGEAVMSAITLYELEYGIAGSTRMEKNKLALQNLVLTKIPFVPFGAEAAEASGQIRAYLKQQGKPIGPYDILIAGHAKSLGLTLVTRNLIEFNRVKNLKVERW